MGGWGWGGGGGGAGLSGWGQDEMASQKDSYKFVEFNEHIQQVFVSFVEMQWCSFECFVNISQSGLLNAV